MFIITEHVDSSRLVLYSRLATERNHSSGIIHNNVLIQVCFHFPSLVSWRVMFPSRCFQCQRVADVTVNTLISAMYNVIFSSMSSKRMRYTNTLVLRTLNFVVRICLCVSRIYGLIVIQICFRITFIIMYLTRAHGSDKRPFDVMVLIFFKVK
jgi:hypothetical protein